jgi:hypothetical protein
MPLTKELDDVIARLGDLSEERQQAAAVLLLDFLEGHDDIVLTAEQVPKLNGAWKTKTSPPTTKSAPSSIARGRKSLRGATSPS